jgi:hypothetical protein
MATTTTTIHVHNSVSDVTSNVVLMFLQPVSPEDNYVYSAWNVLNPSPGSHQQVDLTTSFSGSIAALGGSVSDYTDPVGLTLGTAALITNPNNQSPAIAGTSKQAITADEVGVDNETQTPPTDLSVIWYVNGNKVVETNNTPDTSLNPGFVSTFELKQSVWVMFGQRPQITTTYTIQTFNQAVEIPIPNGATDVYIEAYTTSTGIDTFRPATAAEFNTLVQHSTEDFLTYLRSGLAEQENAQLRGLSSAQVVTRDIHDVNVLPLHGDAFLGGYGIGHIDFDGTTIVELRCGIFPQTKPLPTPGQRYTITGNYDAPILPFNYILNCTHAGRPVSRFAPPTG